MYRTRYKVFATRLIQQKSAKSTRQPASIVFATTSSSRACGRATLIVHSTISFDFGIDCSQWCYMLAKEDEHSLVLAAVKGVRQVRFQRQYTSPYSIRGVVSVQVPCSKNSRDEYTIYNIGQWNSSERNGTRRDERIFPEQIFTRKREGG